MHCKLKLFPAHKEPSMPQEGSTREHVLYSCCLISPNCSPSSSHELCGTIDITVCLKSFA